MCCTRSLGVKQDELYTYKARLIGFHEIIVAVGKHKYCIFLCVCLFVCVFVHPRVVACVCVFVREGGCAGAMACACRCALVALLIQHSKRMRRAILSSVVPVAPTYFSTSSHKRHDFRKNVIEYKIF